VFRIDIRALPALALHVGRVVGGQEERTVKKDMSLAELEKYYSEDNIRKVLY
jgi:hypothetical protein